MSVFAVRIVKRETYFSQEREFGNTYHYLTTLGEPFDDAGVATQLANAEKAVTQADVEFIRWESWGPTDGSAFDNVMRDRQPLTGTGSGGNQPLMYREACAIVAWELPRSPATNRRRWCRKFIRLPSAAGASWTDVQVSGRSPMPSSVTTALQTYANAVDAITVSANTYELCTKDGVAVAAAGVVRAHLFTRDIGR